MLPRFSRSHSLFLFINLMTIVPLFHNLLICLNSMNSSIAIFSMLSNQFLFKWKIFLIFTLNTQFNVLFINSNNCSKKENSFVNKKHFKIEIFQFFLTLKSMSYKNSLNTEDIFSFFFLCLLLCFIFVGQKPFS